MSTVTLPLVEARPSAAAAMPLALAGSVLPDAQGGADEAAGALELLCFRAGGQEYGLPLRSIQEIRSHQSALPIPGQDSAVLGVLDLRGQVIALLDLRRLLGLPPAPAEDAALRAVIVLVHEERRLGLVVDEVLDVLPVPPQRLRLLPQLPGDFAHRHLRALVSTETQRHVLLLDPSPWIDLHNARKHCAADES
ncbi:UNVERIFIED_ORG: chemotaxis protein CheW [Shinella sp. XGS7]|nr:chemotaxis protein CheW [Shinella sp. XGS7]